MQFKAGVVPKKIRSADGPIGACDGLRFVIQIRKRKIEFCSPAAHLFGRVIGIGCDIVTHNGHGADTILGQLPAVADQTMDDGLDIRTMVADEHHQQAVGTTATGQCMLFARRVRQVEIDGGKAEIARWWAERNHDSPPQKGIYTIIAPMNLPRFYCREALSPGAHIELPEPVARHAVRVLRLPPGAPMTLFDGRGGEYIAHIERIERDRVWAELAAWRDVERESPLAVTLIQALQAGDKMDFTIQKAVELGVRDIVPVDSRRSVLRLSGERAAKRVAHWQGVVASACEQCGRNQVPLVAPLESIENWLARPAGNAQRLMLAPDAPQTLADILPTGPIQLLIGAEGGLDPQEILAAQHAGFRPVRLGPRILRTETAGLAALAAIQALWGDFRGNADV